MQTSQRGERGGGFLARQCLLSELFSVRHEESVWMEVWGERGKSAL